MKANGLVVDADAHVIETEHTWDFLDSSDAKYRPDLVSSRDPTRQYWVDDPNDLFQKFRTPDFIRIYLLVTPGLKLKQVGVLPVHLEQALVTSLFQDFTLVDNNDVVSRADR